jgi:hypothetical protein
MCIAEVLLRRRAEENQQIGAIGLDPEFEVATVHFRGVPRHPGRGPQRRGHLVGQGLGGRDARQEIDGRPLRADRSKSLDPEHPFRLRERRGREVAPHSDQSSEVRRGCRGFPAG